MDSISSFAESPSQQKRRICSGTFFNLPRLFVGRLRPKSCSPESEPARSPTSPLDFKLGLSGIGSYLHRSPRSLKSWDSNPNKVGLGIVADSLADLSSPSGRFIGKNIVLLGSQNIVDSPKSLPNDSWVSTSSLVLGSPGSDFRPESSRFSPASGGGSVSSDEIMEMEMSEDYTCVISRGGPNPTKTRIFGDLVLERSSIGNTSTEVKEHPWTVSFGEFLSSCFWCEKKLEGSDIYMYRGEKGFCSCECREKQIAIDGEEEEDDEEAKKKGTGGGC